jgi:TATA-box binding protein (TBP) (component of TFIID and TFIIIB)
VNNPYLNYVEYGASKNETNSKGESGRKVKRKLNCTTKKRFDNQMTFIFSKESTKYNVKLFKNGNVQMTGIKDVTLGSQIVDELINIIARHSERFHGQIVDKPENMKNTGLKVCLMNCDFKVLFNINRNALHKVLLDKGYACTYEPCIYQGVKLSYFISEESQNGKCHCQIRCSGKGSKTRCTRITVAFFQSGSITINGAKNKRHLDILYEFVEKVMRENAEEVQQRYFIPKMKC